MIYLTKNRFWDGLLTGSLLGAIIAWFASPQKKIGASRQIIGRSRQMQNQARRVIRKMRDGVTEFMDK